MACEKPNAVYRPANGGPVSFNRPTNGQAGTDYHKFEIPCGTCILCREEQARQWAVRITHEAQLHDENAFITLTYADQHLPPHGGLRYEDLVKFWKRARKALWTQYKKRLRYYACGEYGDDSLRPHYHACVFGHAFTTDRIIIRESPTLLWTTPELIKWWGLGHVSVGALNFETARYTASYVTKKLRSKQQYVRIDDETGELIALEQPRPFMSRNIAKAWWEENYHHVTAHDKVVINGRPQKPPKAYDRWLAEKNELALEMIKDQRTKKIKKPKPTEEERRARAKNAHARTQQKGKKI